MQRRHPRTARPSPLPVTLLLAALLLFGLACGRRGDPRPRSEVSGDLAPAPAAAARPSGR